MQRRYRSGHLALLLRDHYGKVWLAVLVLGVAPGVQLVLDAWNRTLGINALERLYSTTGIWALNWLLVTLAVTPLRRGLAFLMRRIGAANGKRMSDWNGLIRLRRTLGLLSFFYALAHAVFYFWLEQDWDVAAILQEVSEKRHLIAGTLALILMIPLAVTSTKAMMRRLGRNWKRLHRCVYVIGIAAALHYLWLSKVGERAAAAYAVVLSALLLYRVLAHFGLLFGRPADGGEEVPERPKGLKQNE